MSNIGYILKRLRTIHWKAMFEKIDSIHKKTGKSKISIFMDMQKCARRYSAGYMDYDLFEMYNLTDEQRDTYLTRGRNNELVLKYCDKDYFHLFENKDEFNNLFGEFLKRDWIRFDSSKKDEIISFFKKHDTFMLKPTGGSCGKGIEKIKTSDYSSLDDLFTEIVNRNAEYILEEVIIQHPELNKVHPNSINTVRVVTITTTEDKKPYISIPKDQRKDVKVVPHIITAYFRIGNGKCVDNFNSGGMTAPIDEKTGVVAQLAIDKTKNIYEVHPITGTPIKGFKFPYWEEILELCKKACVKVPEMGYVGWDVAITPDGPVLVECNEFPGHDIYQLPVHTPNKIGIMPKFTNLD